MQPSISPDGEIIYQAVDNLNGGSWAAAIVMFKREDGFKKEYICQPFKQRLACTNKSYADTKNKAGSRCGI